MPHMFSCYTHGVFQTDTLKVRIVAAKASSQKLVKCTFPIEEDELYDGMDVL